MPAYMSSSRLSRTLSFGDSRNVLYSEIDCCQARSSGIEALRRNCSISISKQVLQLVHLRNGLAEERGKMGMKKSVNQSRPCMGTMLDCWRQEGQTVSTGASGGCLLRVRQPTKMMKPRRVRRCFRINNRLVDRAYAARGVPANYIDSLPATLP